jgi:hypothetical protein
MLFLGALSRLKRLAEERNTEIRWALVVGVFFCLHWFGSYSIAGPAWYGLKGLVYYVAWWGMVGAIIYALQAVGRQIERDLEPHRSERRKNLLIVAYIGLVVVGYLLVLEGSDLLGNYW